LALVRGRDPTPGLSAGRRRAGSEASRTLRLGVSETLATYALPPLLGELQHRLPDTELRLTVRDSAALLVALLNNDVELTFWLRETPHPAARADRTGQRTTAAI
jgi:DNA-binding transcriptional LysR family regulator